MLPYVDLKRMRYVIAVARAGGITIAAETLGVTQSALSRSIAEVEASLGTPLFERLPRGIRLTPAGSRFLSGATRIIGDVESLCAEVQGTGESISGPLRIGFAPRGYIVHASRSLKAFAASHPEVAVDITTGSAELLCPRLINGELDLIVGSSAILSRWGNLRIRPLCPFQSAIVMRKDHPLTRLARPVLEKDVLQYPIIMFERLESTFAEMARRHAQNGLPAFNPRYVVDEPATIGRLLLATNSVLPYNSRDFSEISDKFCILKDIFEMPANSFAIVENGLRTTTPAARLFSQMLENSFNS